MFLHFSSCSPSLTLFYLQLSWKTLQKIAIIFARVQSTPTVITALTTMRDHANIKMNIPEPALSIILSACNVSAFLLDCTPLCSPCLLLVDAPLYHVIRIYTFILLSWLICFNIFCFCYCCWLLPVLLFLCCRHHPNRCHRCPCFRRKRFL